MTPYILVSRNEYDALNKYQDEKNRIAGKGNATITNSCYCAEWRLVNEDEFSEFRKFQCDSMNEQARKLRIRKEPHNFASLILIALKTEKEKLKIKFFFWGIIAAVIIFLKCFGFIESDTKVPDAVAEFVSEGANFTAILSEICLLLFFLFIVISIFHKIKKINKYVEIITEEITSKFYNTSSFILWICVLLALFRGDISFIFIGIFDCLGLVFTGLWIKSSQISAGIAATERESEANI